MDGEKLQVGDMGKTGRILIVLAILFLTTVIVLALFPQHEKPQPVTAKPLTEDMLGRMAAGLTAKLKTSGSDIVVLGFDNTLIFDCTRELEPRKACYALYKTFPANEEDEMVLRGIAVHNIRFKTDDSLMSGFAWSKSLQ